MLSNIHDIDMNLIILVLSPGPSCSKVSLKSKIIIKAKANESLKSNNLMDKQLC